MSQNKKQLEQAYPTMLQNDSDDLKQKDLDEFNNKCEECKKEHESVRQNLILTGFKLCKSCRVSKTIFPI